MPIKLMSLLKEYSEKTINGMVQLYKSQTEDSEDQIRQNIKRFQQLTDSIGIKLKNNNPIMVKIIPDELKQSNEFRDITKYIDYNLFLRVLKTADAKPIDIYKQIIDFYKKNNIDINPRIIGNYVARFKQNLNNIVEKVKDKDENALRVIPKELLKNNEFKNILNWRNFHSLEIMLDALFPIEYVEGDEINSAQVDGDKIYDNKENGVEVFKGDEEHKCIYYSKKYKKQYLWCIGGGMYFRYRLKADRAELNRSFYFIFDRTLTENDKYHAVVLHSFAGGGYSRTTAQNSDETNPMSWKEMGTKLFSNSPSGVKLWNKIKDLEKLFKYIPASREEIKKQDFNGVKLTVNEFIEMDIEDKLFWLRANAERREIVTDEIVKSLPANAPNNQPSINDLINYNRTFNFDELKSNIGLVKRYADYRFTRYRDEALPYEFIPHLKEDLQRLYYDKFEKEYLTFDEIEKYFSKNILNEFINKELNIYGFLPEEAMKHMDENQKEIFDVYSVAYKDIEYFPIQKSIDKIKAPSRSAVVSELSYETFTNLPPEKRKKFIEFIKNVGSDIKNIKKYNTPGDGGIFTGIPTSFELNKKLYFIMTNKKVSIQNINKETNNGYYIIDEDANISYNKLISIIPTLQIKNNNIENNEILQRPTGNKTYWIKENEYDSIKAGNVNINLKSLKESNYDKNMLQVRSRIIR